jgi:dipeptidase
MNERQLSMGESTCSGAFAAKAAGAGGQALFCVNELSRLAMERCVTARCAVELMGNMAVRYGFYGASGSFEGGSETLLIADTVEGWVMHFVPYPATNSAVWVARRVPDGEVTVVMNMFTIRGVNLTDPDNFLYSANMIPVARAHGLWDPAAEGEGTFDFTRAFSGGEYAHKFYSGRRMWGAFRLVNPAVVLDPDYGDLRLDAPYPWSVPPAKPLTAADLHRMHRDWYAGTPFDMTHGLAAGPFGSPDRFNGGAAEASVPGAFERSIALHRTTYTHVLQTRAWLPDAVGGITWFGAHAAHGTCFIPLPAGATGVPPSLMVGNATVVDRASLWWAHRYVHNLAQLKYGYAVADVRRAQEEWEAKGLALVHEMDARYGPGADTATSRAHDLPTPPGRHTREQVTAAYFAHADAVLTAWWALADTLMVQYADGFISMPGQKGGPGAAVGYPARWLKAVGWSRGPPPPPPPPSRNRGPGRAGDRTRTSAPEPEAGIRGIRAGAEDSVRMEAEESAGTPGLRATA